MEGSGEDVVKIQLNFKLRNLIKIEEKTQWRFPGIFRSKPEHWLNFVREGEKQKSMFQSSMF